MVPNHLVGLHLSPAQKDRATKSGNQQLRHVTHIWNQSIRAQQYIILRQSYIKVTKIPGQAPHIKTENSTDGRNRTPWARVSLHIQKPKPQASIKNEIEKIHKLFDVYVSLETVLPPSSEAIKNTVMVFLSPHWTPHFRLWFFTNVDFINDQWCNLSSDSEDHIC